MDIAFAGDSIFAGKPGRRTVAEYLAKLLPGDTITNEAIGGLRMNQMNPQIDTILGTNKDVLIWNGGLNDINESVDRTVSGMSTFAADNWDALLAYINGKPNTPATLIWLAVTPWSIGDDDENEAADNLTAHAIADGGVTVLNNVNSTLGEERGTGPPGNFWDAKDFYHHDGVHQRSNGARIIAEALVIALGESLPEVNTSLNLSDSFDGSGLLDLEWDDWLYSFSQGSGEIEPYTTEVTHACLHDRIMTDGNIEIACDVAAGEFFGITFRAQDQDNYYRWEVNDTAGFTRFLIVEGGVATTLKTFASATTGTFTLRVEMEGTTLRCYRDAGLITTETDSTYASGFVGVRGQN